MGSFRHAPRFLAASLALALLAAPAASRMSAAETDLDAFMRQVLERRDDNWKKLQQYILNERETIELRGPAHTPLWGEQRDYTWFIRDGFFVRSPVKFGGVAIADGERRKYEDDYLRREQARDRRAQEAAARGSAGANAPDAAPADLADPSDVASDASAPDAALNLDGLIRQTRQPEFISSAYFLRFRFDEGRYALVGRETVDGRALLRIEYYPAKLFTDQPPRGRGGRGGRGGRDANQERQVQTMMDKASRVTLWVDQPSHQIVKYTFENLTPNFIPANILASVSSATATMTMAQPFPDVWLPRGMEVAFTLTLALGNLDLRYALDYTEYHRAETAGRLVPQGAP